MPSISPAKFVHVVCRTRRFDDMIRWYETVFDAKVQFQNPVQAFLTSITVSMDDGDPDGNRMEFQVDSHAGSDETYAFMHGPGFGVNPIGVEYDPQDWLARLDAGTPASDLLLREVQLPVSPIRGAMTA